MYRSAQFFVYNSRLTSANNFPLIKFETDDELNEFIKLLVSVDPSIRYQSEIPFVVLNNAQLLPDDVRKVHTFTDPITDKKRDGYFRLCDNLVQFKRCNILNNSHEKNGFKELIDDMIAECI